MFKPNFHPVVVSILLLGLAGCDHWATLPESAGFGPAPTLPPPHPTLIPTVQIAPAKGWPPGATPQHVLFPHTPARHIRLTAPSEVNGGPWAAVAELDVVVAE